MKERFQTFTVLVANINRCIRRIKTEEMSEYNLKSPHVSCLYYLYKAGPLTSKELHDICEEDKASISRSIKYLEECGYIFCETQGQKRYQSPLMLTEQGVEVAKKISDKIDNIFSIASAGISEENRAILYECLFHISNNLSEFCDQYKE